MLYKHKPWENIDVPAESEWSQGLKKDMNMWLSFAENRANYGTEKLAFDKEVVMKKCYWNYQQIQKIVEGKESEKKLMKMLDEYGFSSSKFQQSVYCSD